MKKNINYQKIKLKKDFLPTGLEILSKNFPVFQMNKSFYWDDLNIYFFRGNYLLDLGDTILPSQAIMVTRCTFGKIRIIVPVGVGVFVDYFAFRGTFIYENKQINLKNKRIKYKAQNTDEFPQRINIYVNSFISSLEIVLG